MKGRRACWTMGSGRTPPAGGQGRPLRCGFRRGAALRKKQYSYVPCTFCKGQGRAVRDGL